jgi:hypothetical protein
MACPRTLSADIQADIRTRCFGAIAKLLVSFQYGRSPWPANTLRMPLRMTCCVTTKNLSQRMSWFASHCVLGT